MITVGRSDDPARVGVIVTGVDKAGPEDMRALRSIFKEGLSGWAYFIRVVLVNEDGKAMSGFSGPELHGDREDGGDAGQVRLLGTDLRLPHCIVHSSPPGGWDTPGARFETCRIVQAPPNRVRLDVEGGVIHWE